MPQDTLSIILPVHNEIDSLEIVVSEWDSSIKRIPGLHYVFIICEDGSIDGTKELIYELERRFPVINNSTCRRRGYGQAVRDGIACSKTDYILCIDSDGQTGPERLDEVWSARSEDYFIMGQRYNRRDSPTRLIYSKLFKVYHRFLFPNRLHDPSCPFVFGHTNLFKKVNPLLVYMKEGFWWGFVGACWKEKIPIKGVRIYHRERIAGATQVYKIGKMPGIIVRNAIGLLKLRLA